MLLHVVYMLTDGKSCWPHLEEFHEIDSCEIRIDAFDENKIDVRTSDSDVIILGGVYDTEIIYRPKEIYINGKLIYEYKFR